VKRAWKITLKNAGVPYFPIYNLRHVFCTRLSWVAPDALVQRAMRQSSPETKRWYQLGLVDQIREHLERVNEKTYRGGGRHTHRVSSHRLVEFGTHVTAGGCVTDGEGMLLLSGDVFSPLNILCERQCLRLLRPKQ
jgi:hypothetical protein